MNNIRVEYMFSEFLDREKKEWEKYIGDDDDDDNDARYMHEIIVKFLVYLQV